MFRGHVSPPSIEAVKTVTIKTIPHNDQRYPTVGDWIWDAETGDLQVRVSSTEDWREAMAVGVHEVVEALCCIQDGVNPLRVDSFDIDYEQHRKAGDDSEPGDDPIAPYYSQHQTATNVEHILSTALGLHWDSYNEHLAELSDEEAQRGSESTASHS